MKIFNPNDFTEETLFGSISDIEDFNIDAVASLPGLEVTPQEFEFLPSLGATRVSVIAQSSPVHMVPMKEMADVDIVAVKVGPSGYVQPTTPKGKQRRQRKPAKCVAKAPKMKDVSTQATATAITSPQLGNVIEQLKVIQREQLVDARRMERMNTRQVNTEDQVADIKQSLDRILNMLNRGARITFSQVMD